MLKRNQSYDLLKFWGFYEFRVIFEPIIPDPSLQKHKIMKSIPTFHGHNNFGSFWARDSSKKVSCSSWFALSNGVKSEGNTCRAVQGDWKLCTCTARQWACSSAHWDASHGTKLSIFWEKSGTLAPAILFLTRLAYPYALDFVPIAHVRGKLAW